MGRNANDDGVGRNVFGYHRAGRKHGIAADRDVFFEDEDLLPEDFTAALVAEFAGEVRRNIRAGFCR